jgi:hypothetical protein
VVTTTEFARKRAWRENNCLGFFYTHNLAYGNAESKSRVEQDLQGLCRICQQDKVISIGQTSYSACGSEEDTKSGTGVL